MELRQLRYFVAVADEGSISAAARKLGMTQPALSRQVKALEGDLGWELLARGNQSVALTHAGEVVSAEGRKILTRADRGLQLMRREIEGVVLRVGYAPSLVGGFLSVALACFSQLHPQIRVELLDLSSLGMADGMRAGDLDVIVGIEEAHISGVEWVAVRRLGWSVAIGGTHPLAEREELTEKDLDGQRLLLYCRSDYPAYWESVTAFFQKEKIDAKIAGEYDGITSLTTALEGGLGIALVAETTRFSGDASVVKRPVSPMPDELQVSAGIAKAGASTKWARAFSEELRKAAAT